FPRLGTRVPADNPAVPAIMEASAVGCPETADQSPQAAASEPAAVRTDAAQLPTMESIKAAIARAEEEQAARADAVRQLHLAAVRTQAPLGALEKAPLAQAATRQQLTYYSATLAQQ